MKKIQLSIPTPCHEDWNNMTPDNKGRFCASCQKTVIDFSTMSDRQLAEFFKKPTGSLCGRFHQDQLEREIGLPKKHLPWVKYFFTIALPAFLVSCKFAGRQATQGKAIAIEQHLTGDTVALPVTSKVGEVAPLPLDTAIVSVQSPPFLMGDIMLPQIDSSALRIDSALPQKKPVHLNSEHRERCKLQAITVDSDCFVRPPHSYQPASVTIKEQEVNTAKTEDLSMYRVGGISPSIVYRIRVPNNNTGLSPILIKKQVPASFSIYPNPVQANSTFILDGKNLEGGSYQLAIVNTAGQVVQSQELILQSKTSKETIQLKSVSAGVYFVELSNKKGRVFSKKILVQ